MCDNCISGNHVWDVKYEEVNAGQKYCLCCEHSFASDKDEELGLDSAIMFEGENVRDKVLSDGKKNKKGKFRRIS
jgi:hypothetical protein